ncbi:MAG: multiheme c-type cytochrome [Myxococcota bacterium]
MGGLAKIASVVKATPCAALLDGGNLLFPSESWPDAEEDQHRLKAELLARAYRHMGVIALNFARVEASRSPVLRSLQEKAAMPWVSANVRPLNEVRAPVVAQSFMRKVGGIRFGLTGAVLPETVTATDSVTVLEHGPAVANEVRVLRQDGAEVVIVLGQMGRSAAEILADVVPDIDVIIYGPGSELDEPLEPPTRVGRSILVEAGTEGRYLGQLVFRLEPAGLEPGGPGADPLRLLDADRAGRLDRKREALRAEWEGLRRSGAPEEVLEARKQRLDDLERRATAASTGSNDGSEPFRPSVEIDRIAIGANQPEDPLVRAWMNRYDQQLARLNIGAVAAEVCEVSGEDRAHYVGNDGCLGCHPEASKFWLRTAHAEAWATLERHGKTFDLTCVGCHTVGFREPGGWCRFSELGGFRNVGCESCHGPGSRHVQMGAAIDRADDPESCTGVCHVPKHSDRFEWATYRAAVVGPGHGIDIRRANRVDGWKRRVPPLGEQESRR